MAGPRPAPLFRLDDVRLSFGDRCVLDGVSVDLPACGIVTIEGPSGAGKSTLLRLFNRLAVPDSGRVLVRLGGGTGADGLRDVATIDPLDLRRRVAMVFQQPVVFAGTVLDNLREAQPTLDRVEAGAAVAAVGLPGRWLDRDARDLSGGEVQRLCLARALRTTPDVLLLDEPTSALDDASTGAVEDLARELAAGGLHQVWVSHDRHQVGRISDHRLHLTGGRLVEVR